MVSETTQTKRRRHNRDQRIGVKRKRRAKREGTPSFPLDPASGVNSTAVTAGSSGNAAGGTAPRTAAARTTTARAAAARTKPSA